MKDTTHGTGNIGRHQYPASRAIQARLVAQNSSFRQFALERGYKPRTVTQVVARWANKQEMPRGHLSLCILRDLSRTIGQEIVPGILGPINTLEKNDNRPIT